MQENEALNTHSEKLQRILRARETVQKINEARQAQKNVSDSSSQDQDGPQVAGEAISAMHDVTDLCQDNDGDGPSLEELVSSLNPDQVRVYDKVKSRLEHHRCGCCQCSDLTPLDMFVSGVAGTGKSFLIKTICALVTSLCTVTGSRLCAVAAPTGLAGFNVGGVTIHRLLQLPIDHEGRSAGYWRLGKELLKVMCTSLSKLKVLTIDEISMVSSLNLAYVHLCPDEIFPIDEWFGGVNVLFVGDMLQTAAPPQ